MEHLQATGVDRVADLARSLDHLSEDDFCTLAGIRETTADAWRRRGKGPTHVRVGTRVLYPRASVAAWLETLVRPRARRVAEASL